MGHLLNERKKLPSENGQNRPKIQSLISFNIDKFQHVSPLLIRKTSKCVTGQKQLGKPANVRLAKNEMKESISLTPL